MFDVVLALVGIVGVERACSFRFHQLTMDVEAFMFYDSLIRDCVVYDFTVFLWISFLAHP